MPQTEWVVHKFGGTSVANAERYKGVFEVLKKEPDARRAVVVSAMSKVTDALIELVELARTRNDVYLEKLDVLKQRHRSTVDELLPESARSKLFERIDADFKDIAEVLRGVWQVRSSSERIVELVSGYGEIWSAQFLNAFLFSQGIASTWIDARQILVVEPGDTTVAVNWTASQPKLDAWLGQNSNPWVVITGFVASTADGIPTTLKRNGSDYSASIFGALFKARDIVIWTDVDGVLSADPRLVPEAVVLDDMSYQEATELAYFGAKVVHPSTMAPAIDRKIPIWIRNTFRPQLRGTKIHTKSNSQEAIKGFSTIDNIAMINVEGTGMMGVPGVAQRLFGALKEVNVSVVMISQASSEHSICFAVPAAQSSLAKSTVERAFFAELHHGHIQTIDVADSFSILAAVGDNMVNQPGLAGKFLTALGRAGVNVRAIAQGSSERNISVVIDRAEATRGLRAVHSGFFLSAHTLSIGVIGSGWIGGTLLNQLNESCERLRRENKIDFRVRGIASSKKMLLNEASLDLGNWKTSVDSKGETLDLAKFVAHIKADHLPHAVIIDCTASEAVAKNYEVWLKAGIHVITPNKKAGSGPFGVYQKIKQAERSSQTHFLYETTVGAGLPIINTLRDLVQTGDRVTEIEGVLSGTLSYIFNTLNPQKRFSEVVIEAKNKGYTEPDPRDDLSGLDVARKVVILAREMGLSISMQDVKVSGLVPQELQSGGIEDFLSRLPHYDAQMQKLLDDAKSRGEVLKYVGRIDSEGGASVELKSYKTSHPFAHMSATDNVVAFRTARYSNQPLIVQGPGAGPEVTSAGVFADLLRLSAYLGASL